MPGHLSIDIRGVTVTIRVADRERFVRLLGSSIRSNDFYGGWIEETNPSDSLIGFYLLFEEDQVYADLHNVPFYYREWPGGFSAYEKRIIRHVRRSPVFRKWKGHASRFDAVHLPLFVELMGSLASQIVVEPGEEKLPNRWAAREQDTDEN